MKRVVVLVLGATLMALAVPAVAGMERTVRTLTAPEMAGRGSGSPGAAAAADSLAAWLDAAGFTPAFAGEWFQEYMLDGEGWAGQDLTGARSRNVGGMLPGRGDLAGRWLVLGAHYDHLGRVAAAGPEAPPPAAGEYYPGANDNASGVAILLEAVRGLVAAEPTGSSRSVLVVFFGDEESGLQGSSAYVADPPVPLAAVDVMVNLDTVGRLLDGALYVSGVGTSPPLRGLAEGAAGDLDLRLAEGGWSGSDHMSFNTREVPVVFLFGGAYPDYNRPTDTWDNLAPDDMAAVLGYANRLIGALHTDPSSFPWIMVGDGPLRETGDDPGDQNRSTWLGTLPDFTEDISGYKLAGVFDESPAARSGLQKGDVLLRLGGADVTDLATFTRALRSHGPGDLVEIELRRDGALLRFTVVLGDRADRH